MDTIQIQTVEYVVNKGSQFGDLAKKKKQNLYLSVCLCVPWVKNWGHWGKMLVI